RGQAFAEGAPGNASVTVLRVSFQDALGENEIGIATPTRTVLLTAKAQKLFRPFNIILQPDSLGSFPFPKVIGERDETDVLGLRKAAQKANPGIDTSLRVIFCTFKPTTSTGTSNGAVTGIEGFKNFVLINKEKIHPDLGTLAHEMIHCSDDFLMSDLMHVQDSNNVFSFGQNRTIVSSEHVTALRKSFFKL
ncbi:MAG TPA: hypothetical protein VMT22_14525, partial [Terriglobales bacterium]|nr:hypothetical protein [Terriglobales bacterium]